jgi:CubicO group peptidase (beta-lactamase class C family)
MDNQKSPGAAVVIVRNGEVLLSKGYGMANLEHRIPVTSSTVFDIASVSKQFAGMAVAMLIEQGKLSLEDDVRKYIPELPDFGHTITIYHLLHHTSGLRDWPGTLALAGAWRT